ncbi:MAG: GNAT family N-acetyltransferase [Pirellulales bacterium]
MPTSTRALTDGRLDLRAPSLADIDAAYLAVRESIREVGAWLTWCHPDYQREDTAEWIRRCIAARAEGEFYEFFIFDRAGAELLGGCGLNQFDQVNLRANLGYWVRTSRTGSGVATAATRLVARFGLEDLGLERIEILAAAGNLASQRVAAAAGARREGLLRKRLRIAEFQQDAVSFSLIPADLHAAQP